VLGDICAFPLGVYVWAIPIVTIAYPLRPDTNPESLQHSWGGPGLAGAWSVHAIGAILIFLLIGAPLLSLIARVQFRLATPVKKRL
jgi:hypothetical protein